MFRRVWILVATLLSVTLAYAQEVLVGATDTSAYLVELRGRRVAVLANHTAMYSDTEHIVDMMYRSGINIVGIFAPEHGFRGGVEAGRKHGVGRCRSRNASC